MPTTRSKGGQVGTMAEESRRRAGAVNDVKWVGKALTAVEEGGGGGGHTLGL